MSVHLCLIGKKVQQLRAYGIGRVYYLSVGDVADTGLAAFAAGPNLYLADTTGHDGSYNGAEINTPIVAAKGLPGGIGLHRALVSPIADNRELKPYKPFVLVALGGIGRASLNKGGLGNNAPSDTFDDVVLDQLDAKTCDTVSVRCDTSHRVNRSADLDVAVGKVAHVEGLHLGTLHGLTVLLANSRGDHLLVEILQGPIVLRQNILNVSALDLGDRGLLNAGLFRDLHLGESSRSDSP